MITEGDDYAQHKAWRKKNKGKVRAQNARARKRKGYKDKHAGRQRTYQARKSGKLKKPSKCPKCHKRSKKMEYDHHRGYNGNNKSKGRWLCGKCHMRIQKRKLIKDAMASESVNLASAQSLYTETMLQCLLQQPMTKAMLLNRGVDSVFVEDQLLLCRQRTAILTEGHARSDVERQILKALLQARDVLRS